MSAIILEIPMPPSVNNLFRNIPGGGRAKTAHYKSWATEAGWMVVQQRNLGGRHEMMKSEVEVSVLALRQDRRKRDLDNLLKPIMDLLVSTGTIEDDRHVAAINARWVTEGPPCTVRVRHVVPWRVQDFERPEYARETNPQNPEEMTR